MAINYETILKDLPPRRLDNQILLPKNLSEEQIADLKEKIKKIHAEQIYNFDKAYNPEEIEKPSASEFTEEGLEYYLSDLEEIKENLNNEKIYNNKNKPYALIPEYHELLNNIIKLLSNQIHTESLDKILSTSHDIARIIPQKTFGHTLQTLREKKFIAYIAYGLIFFGLGKEATKNHLTSWLGVSEKTVRDTLRLIEKEKIDKVFKYEISEIAVLESQIDLKRRLLEIRGTYTPFRELVINFLSKETSYSFNHPKARPAFLKFKEHILRKEKILEEKEFLLKICDEIAQ